MQFDLLKKSLHKMCTLERLGLT